MGAGVRRGLFRLAVYPLALVLLVVIASAGYASPIAESAPVVTRPSAAAPAGPLATIVPTPAPQAPPVQTLLAPSAWDQLVADLNAIAARSGGRVGLSLQELSGPRRARLSMNGGLSFYAASTYKLPLLMAEAQQIAAGQVSGSDKLCFIPSDAEDGWFTDYAPGSCFTRAELARRAGQFSDNTAAQILVRYLGGGGALNAYARAIEMNGSALWFPNTTTADDLTNAWVNEAMGALGGAAAQQWLYPLLTRTAFEQGIPSGLPAGTTVTHKVGWMSGTELDAAYVRNGGIAYVLTAAIDGVDDNRGWSVIAQLSARVWQYETSRPGFAAAVTVKPVTTPRANRY
jgi:beta-lactamase class A